MSALTKGRTPVVFRRKSCRVHDAGSTIGSMESSGISDGRGSAASIACRAAIVLLAGSTNERAAKDNYVSHICRGNRISGTHICTYLPVWIRHRWSGWSTESDRGVR